MKKLCLQYIQVLDTARVAKGDERKVVLEILEHANHCVRCHYAIVRSGFSDANAMKEYLTVKAWPEYDKVMEAKT